MPKFTLDVTQEEYEKAGSKFITFPLNAPVGSLQFRDIEVGMLDWDTPGQSVKIPVTITEEGPDLGKQEKLSFGVSAEAIWKGKQLYKAICGKDMPMAQGADKKKHPAPDSDDLLGKPAVGVWQLKEGKKGGVGEVVTYPKLVDIQPAGAKPKVTDLGI